MMADAKDRVKQQFAAAGDAYVRSTGHAEAADLHRMLDLTNPGGTEALLDIATGGGHVARVFSPHVASVVATDLTPEILVHAEKAFAQWQLTNIRIAVADAEDLPLNDATFDIVTCRIAPHHFPHPEAFIFEVARVLRPGGQFVLIDSTVPPGEDGELFNRIEAIRDPSHVRSLLVAEWTSLIKSTGMHLTHQESYRKRHDFADWVTRSRTSDADCAQLEQLFRSATPAQREFFEIEFAAGEECRVIGFADTKTLFHAIAG